MEGVGDLCVALIYYKWIFSLAFRAHWSHFLIKTTLRENFYDGPKFVY